LPPRPQPGQAYRAAKPGEGGAEQAQAQAPAQAQPATKPAPAPVSLKQDFSNIQVSPSGRCLGGHRGGCLRGLGGMQFGMIRVPGDDEKKKKKGPKKGDLVNLLKKVR
jgi:hypothetical protein